MRKPGLGMALRCACMAAAETSLTGGQTLTIRVSPAMAREPASLRISAVVEPDERNRTLEIKAESAGTRPVARCSSMASGLRGSGRSSFATCRTVLTR